MLRGENFEIKSESGIENFGFFATRYVKARNPEEAELIAVGMIRKEKNLLETLSRESNLEPKIYLEKIWTEHWWKRVGGSGYSFYTMGSEK